MPEPVFNPDAIRVVQERVRLRADVMPIDRRIVDSAEGSEELRAVKEEMGATHWVDFEGGDLDKLNAEGFKHAGPESYLISPIGEGGWFSDHYFHCTAVVAIGRDKNTGKEVSFLSHQDPKYFIDGGSEKEELFSSALRESLDELKARSQEGTVEVSLLGGNFSLAVPAMRGYKSHHYKQSIKRLGEIVRASLGFDPTVLAGPNSRIGSETVVVIETQKRKVWIERSKQPEKFDQPFQAHDIDEVEKRWYSTA